MPLHLQRQREIVEILTRNGFGVLAAETGLASRWPSRAFVAALTPEEYRVDEALRSPRIVRRTLEELGPTFIKLGQILSTRADLIPPAFQVELAKLRSAAPAVPVGQIRDVVETELGAPLETVFATFEPTPLGSASIGQTHAATLPSGESVVVKVRRPGVAERLRVDIDVLMALATQVQRRWPVARELDLVSFVDEFDRQIAGELDYTREGRNPERIAHNFADRPGLRCPQIHWSHSTDRVLTMQRFTGITIDDVEALDAAGIDRRALGRRAATYILDMILIDGFFHGDPHAGNLLVDPRSGDIELLDFGMVGSLSDSHRQQLVALVAAFIARDAERMADAVVDLAPPLGRVVRRALERATGHLITEYADKPLAEVPIVAVVNELIDMMRTQRLKPAPELSMVAKMLAMVDGLGRVLDPDFDMMGLLRPYGLKVLRHHLQPDAVLKSLLSAASEASLLGAQLPEQARRLLRHYEQDGLRFSVDDASLAPTLRRLDALGDRLVAGMLLAALINAVGALGATDNRWLAKARGPLLITGSATAAALAGFLADSIRRRR